MDEGFFKPGRALKRALDPAIITRFLKYVKLFVDGKGETHWMWTGGKCSKGYGTFRGEQSRNILSHRFSYAAFKGEIKDCDTIDHIMPRCGLTLCVRPEHLRKISHSANTGDGNKWRRHKKKKEQYETHTNGSPFEPAPF